MHKLVKQKLGIFKKQKIEIILTKNFRSFSMLYFFVGTNSSLSLREYLFYSKFKKLFLESVIFFSSETSN